MGISGGPNIVRDSSLVLELDAADRNSYPGSGVSWFDLSGNNRNGVLTGLVLPTYNSSNNGCFSFNGNATTSSVSYVNTNYSGSATDFTAIAWFKSTTATAYDRIFEKDYLTGFWMGRNQSIPNQWGGGILNNTAPTYGNFITLTDNQWHCLAMVRNGTTQILYGDGITNTSSFVCSGTVLNSNFTLKLGSDTTNGTLNGFIASAYFYNRALSAQEILQNYNQLKSRFNL